MAGRRFRGCARSTLSIIGCSSAAVARWPSWTGCCGLPPRTYPLWPLRREALRAVIEGPARLAGITVADDLVDRLVADTDSGEALPLLAFTLAQLADGVGRGGQLSAVRYEQLGVVHPPPARLWERGQLAAAVADTGAHRESRDLVTDRVDLSPTARTFLRTSIRRDRNTVLSVAVSSDGHTLATASDDNTAWLWETNIDSVAAGSARYLRRCRVSWRRR